MPMYLLTILLAAAAPAQSGAVQDFQDRCEEEGRRLWGNSLCAPVVIVDPSTGKYSTSRQPPSVPLPATRANTTIKWGGEDWIMLLDPVPADAASLRSTLYHEAWHAHQAELGFPANAAVAPHLETPTERYLLRLEWAALKEALQSTGARQRGHIAQALAFRHRRIGSAEERRKAERDQMRHEGLAAYTGVKLSGEAKRLALEELKGGDRRAALARSFAYVSGPAWGLLLDAYSPGWKKSAGADDLPDLMPIRSARIARPDDYGATAILLAETAAAVERNARLRAAAAATAEHQALRLPLMKMSMDFDPNRVSALDNGSVYEKIAIRDAWGEIRVDGTPLRIASDFSAAFTAWPLPAGALKLAPGWRVEEREAGGARLVPPAS